MNQLIRDINEVLRSTHASDLPLSILCFILPFSPCCIKNSYRRAREERSLAVLKRWNETVFMQRGVHWEITPFLRSEELASISYKGLPLLMLMRNN